MSPASSDKPESNPTKRRAAKPKPKHAVVMVLGDVGRSPRMQYHTLSLLEEGHYVTLMGYVGEGLIPPLESALIGNNDGDSASSSQQSKSKPSYHGHLHVLRMAPYKPPKSNILQRLLYYPLRLLSLFYCVICTLWVDLNHVPHTTTPVDVILVQNPPSMPTLLIAYMYCVWQGLWSNHRPRFVIDWHNLGYTMFESPDNNPKSSSSSSSFTIKAAVQQTIRTLAKWYEKTMAPLADAHLTVTEAMEVWLGENFNVHGERVRVLYDKPPLMFRPTGVDEQHELFGRLKLKLETSQYQNDEDESHDIMGGTTIFTQSTGEKDDGTPSVTLRKDRPALLVSSTSWTPDEDFSILLDALKELHTKITTTTTTNNSDDNDRSSSTTTTSFPKVLVIVTGKGPQKAHYLPLLAEFNKTHHPYINIQTLWLEAGDYPKLLGCATLGISLHTSTSGLDLPMKVLDMFGCQVPVCAIGFDCLGELVKDGVNGRVFRDGNELASQLFDLLAGYPGDEALDRLEMYRCNIRGMVRWKENWEECARELIVGDWK